MHVALCYYALYLRGRVTYVFGNAVRVVALSHVFGHGAASQVKVYHEHLRAGEGERHTEVGRDECLACMGIG